MCRLYGFIANEPTKVDCSLVYAQNALLVQSRADERGYHHADGWGIATYQEGRPVVNKKTTAAFEDQLFSAAAERTYSKTIIAHVRKATVGETSVQNTHPFVAGNWTFAHNGTVTGFEKLRSELEQETAPDLQALRVGATDSEQYFLWLLTRLRKLLSRSTAELESGGLSRLLKQSVLELDERCRRADVNQIPRLNFVLTDGIMLLACRWNNSLNMIRRSGIYDCEICGIPHIHHHETINHKAVAISSEPVTQEDWEEVPNESVVVSRV